MMEKGNCHSCGHESDWICEKCEQIVCERCTVSYTQFNQIDYTLCNNCNDTYQEEYNEEKYVESLSPSEHKKYIREKRIISTFLSVIKNKFGFVKK